MHSSILQFVLILLFDAFIALSIFFVWRDVWEKLANNSPSLSELPSVPWMTALSLCALSIGFLGFFVVSPYQASDFPVSDAVEYAVSAKNIIAHGQYEISLGGFPYPPRFSPWFSLFVLSPTYAVIGPELGNSIVGITAFVMVAMISAFLLGHLVAGVWGATLAPIALMSMPGLRYFGRNIMSDIPFAAMGLVLLLLYLLLSSRADHDRRYYLLAGNLVGFNTLIRPLGVLFLLPFIFLAMRREERHKLQKLILLGLALLVAAYATAAYNLFQFGDWARSGYHLWTSVPYDYPSLTFSLNYVVENAEAFLVHAGGLPLILFFGTLLFFTKNPELQRHLSFDRDAIKQIVCFLLIAGVPLILFHLLYFYTSTRFWIPIRMILTVLVGALLGGFMAKMSGFRAVLVACGFAIGVVAYRVFLPPVELVHQPRLERLSQYANYRAMIVTKLNPLLVEQYLLEGSGREFIPWSREGEYVSHYVTWERVKDPHPMPTSWEDHRAAGLLRGSIRDPYPVVAVENLNLLDSVLMTGRQVLVDLVDFSVEERELLEQRFQMIELAGDLIQLKKASH